MGKTYFIQGGSRKVRSIFVEEIAGRYNTVTYVDTSVWSDAQMDEHTALYRAARPKEWLTVEEYRDVVDVLQSMETQVALVECVAVMVSNLLLDYDADWEMVPKDLFSVMEKEILAHVRQMLAAAKDSPADVIFASNDDVQGLVPEYPIGRVFRDILSKVNQTLAKGADEAFMLVSGIPVRLK